MNERIDVEKAAGTYDPWANGWSVGGGEWESTIRHELGHIVDHAVEERDAARHAAIIAAIDEMLRDTSKPLESISKYGAATAYGAHDLTLWHRARSEAFAETFSTVTHPLYKRSRFPEVMHRLLELMEALVE